MEFILSRPSFAKVFAASAIGLAVTGCATVPGTVATGCTDETKGNILFLFQYSSRAFNKDCALKEIADQYSRSMDAGEKVLGQYLKEKLDPRIEDSADRTREEAVEKTTPYKVGGFEVRDGRKTFILIPARQVPAASSP